MRLNERIPNLVLFLELDEFFTPFWAIGPVVRTCVFNMGPYGQMHTIF